MANELTYQSIFQGEQIDARLTAVQSLQETLAAVEQAITAKYTKPADGIPETDLDAAVQSALAKARSAVQDLSNYYTKTEIDALLSAVNSQQYVDVTALPTASADTLGKIYLVGPDANNQYARYYTSYDGSAYSWVAAGTTEINLALYATKAELSQLSQKVGKFAIPITESGKYIKLSDGPGASVPSPTGNGTYLYSRYPVSMGDVVTVNGVGGSGPRLWGFVDSNSKIISVADASVTGNNLQLVAPANSAEIIINSTVAGYGVSYILKNDSIQGQLDWKTNGTEAIVPQITENSGKYIGYDGEMRTTNDAAFTSKFFVDKGSEIVLNARGYLDRTAMIAKVVTEGSEYIPLVMSTDSAVHDYTYIVLESGYYACSYYITTGRSLRVFKNTPSVLAEWCRSLGSSSPTDSFVLLNPYAGANYNNPVCSQSHEHCFDKAKLESSYNRGIRVIACSHYAPATPRFPLSSFNVAYQDYKSKQALLDGDTELVTRYTTGAIPTLNTDSGDINTDTIPQIANAERPLVRGDAFGQHMNILGLLWGDPGHSLCNGEVRENTAENVQIKSTYSLESFTKFNELLEDEENWQFGSRYVFGTINHCSNVEKALVILNNCPDIFKAMELFNQGYSEETNGLFRNAYDNVLKTGKRIWGTAVVDWQDDWATWAYTTQDEKDEWQDKYDALTPEEQAEYGSAENYYMETGRYKFDRGTNVLLMDGTYDGLSASDKAKEAIMAYLGGRYYMSGRNTKSMKVVTDNHLVTFKLSDYADKAYVVTANGRTEYTNVDTINYVAQATDKFVRFEAFWDDGEFVFSNPVWVEPVS